MTPEPQAAPEPLTAEEVESLREEPVTRDAEAQWWIDRLLATLDAARASQAAPVASGALDRDLRRIVGRYIVATTRRDTAAMQAEYEALYDYMATGAAAHPDTAGEPGETT